nr:hypothetical protein [Tanacetum cinerariifolium]
LKDQFEDFSDSNEEFSSPDDDSFSIDNIDYVEASPPDSELVSSEVMEIVIPEVGGIDDDILLTIKDDILREKLLNVNLFIAKIEALNDNPTPSSDFKTKSSSTSPNSLLEETNTFDNSLPEFKTFCFDVEEISSGSTTTHSDISLPEYEVIHEDHVKEISSGSPTTHYDSPLYESFIFDLSIKPFPPANRSDFYEFVDELIHFISFLEYDCFLFKVEPNSRDFTMDVVEDISLTKEPKVHNALPTHPTLQLNLKFLPFSEYLFTYVVWIFFPFLVKEKQEKEKIGSKPNKNGKQLMPSSNSILRASASLGNDLALEASMDHKNKEEFNKEMAKSHKRHRDDQDHPPPPPKDSDRSKKKKHDYDVSASKQPPVKKSLAWKTSDRKEAPFSSSKQKSASPLEQHVDDVSIPDDVHLSDTEDTDWEVKARQSCLESLAYKLVRPFHKNNISLQFQMEECHLLLTDQIDLLNPEGNRVMHDISKPLPLGGPPGQVTIQTQYFFKKYLEYLVIGDKERRNALSIFKLKAAYYPDFELEELILSLWIESERDYDISAAYNISHWLFKRKEFYITRHSAPSDRNAVRSHMRILSAVSLKTFFRYGYTYLKEIILCRADYKEYKISKSNFKNLHPNDFEDRYMLHLYGKLNHLSGADKVHPFNAVFSTWMAFGGNTRNLGSFREETDKITYLHQIHEEVLFIERGDGIAGYRNTIDLPVGNIVVPLRSDTIRLVQNRCSFQGLWFEDPNQHLKDFLKLVDSLDLDDENGERMPTSIRTTFEARVRDYMAAHTERMERFENAIFKRNEQISDKVSEMFGLLKELTTSRAPKKVLIMEEAKFLITKNVNSISLTKKEEERSKNTDVTIREDIEKLTKTEMELPVKGAEKEDEAENEPNRKARKEETTEAPSS